MLKASCHQKLTNTNPCHVATEATEARSELVLAARDRFSLHDRPVDASRQQYTSSLRLSDTCADA